MHFSMDSWIFILFNGLKYFIFIIYSGAQIVPDLVSGSPFKLTPFSFWHGPFSYSFLFFDTTKYSRLILYFTGPAMAATSSPRNSGSFEWKKLFWNPEVGSRCASYYCDVIAFGFSQGTELQKFIYIHINSNWYLQYYSNTIFRTWNSLISEKPGSYYPQYISLFAES